jgi:hypothetical protein
MTRSPFVWETQVRREVLDDEFLRLRGVPYSVWRQTLVVPFTKTVIGRDNRPYRLRVTAAFVKGSQDIRVTMELARPVMFRRHVMRQTFVISPDNKLSV